MRSKKKRPRHDIIFSLAFCSAHADWQCCAHEAGRMFRTTPVFSAALSDPFRALNGANLALINYIDRFIGFTTWWWMAIMSSSNVSSSVESPRVKVGGSFPSGHSSEWHLRPPNSFQFWNNQPPRCCTLALRWCYTGPWIFPPFDEPSMYPPMDDALTQLRMELASRYSLVVCASRLSDLFTPVFTFYSWCVSDFVIDFYSLFSLFSLFFPHILSACSWKNKNISPTCRDAKNQFVFPSN